MATSKNHASTGISELDVIRQYYSSVLTLSSDPTSTSSHPTSTPSIPLPHPPVFQSNDPQSDTPTIKRRKGRKSDTFLTHPKPSSYPTWKPLVPLSKVHLIPLQSTSSPSSHITSSPAGSSAQKKNNGNGQMRWRDSSTLPPDSPEISDLEQEQDQDQDRDQEEVDELRSSPALDPFGAIGSNGAGLVGDGSPVKKKKNKVGRKSQADKGVLNVEVNGEAHVTPKRSKKDKQPKSTAIVGDTPATPVTDAPAPKAKKERKKRVSIVTPAETTSTPGPSATTAEQQAEDTDMDQNTIEDLVSTSPPASPVKEKKTKSRKSLLSDVQGEGVGGGSVPSTPVTEGKEGKKEKKSTKKNKGGPSWVVNTPEGRS